MKNLFIFASVLIVFAGCDNPIFQKGNVKHYLLLSHTRLLDTVNQKVDPRLEQIDFQAFDLLFLGGDMTEETSKSYSTLTYLDSLFDLKSPNTLWALGNHDNTNLANIRQATRRPITYTYYKNGITFVVLYTQEKEDWICTITGNQLEMLQNVTDTISESSHLVILSHKLIWLWKHPELKKHTGKGYYDWSCNYRIHETNWPKDILPRLRAVQKRGIQVICMAGDIGNNVREFEEHTKDGIYYLASGLCALEGKRNESEILLFEHDLDRRKLSWKFVNLDDYLKSGTL